MGLSGAGQVGPSHEEELYPWPWVPLPSLRLPPRGVRPCPRGELGHLGHFLD